jgi:FAD/FMN-containing dehydrogenase
LRGGGGNFGIVTNFEYQLHPVGPEVYGGAVFYSAEQAGDLLRFYREWTLPNELFATITLHIAHAAPFLPVDVHGQHVAAVIVCYFGSNDDGERALGELRAFGSPLADVVGPLPYTTLQSLIDPLWGPGGHNYFKSGYLSSLNDDVVQELLRGHAEMTSEESGIHVHHFGGAVAVVGPDESAFAGRDAPFVVNVVSRWTDPAESELNMEWARLTYERLSPFATGGVYVNFLSGDEGSSRVRAAYGSNYDRLVALKSRYDPQNIFRLNQNIEPTAKL